MIRDEKDDVGWSSTSARKPKQADLVSRAKVLFSIGVACGVVTHW